jgi:DNA primase
VIDVEKILLFLELPLYAQRGSEVNGLCPMHKKRTGKDDHRPSWWINTETGAHICFSCGYKGNIYTLISDVKGIDYHDARDYIDDTAEVPIDSLMKRIKELPQYVVAEETIPMSEARLAVYGEPPDIELKKRFLTREAVNKYEVLWDETNEAWILPIRDPETFSLLGWQEKGARGRFFKNQPAGVKKSKTVFGVQHLNEEQLIVVESPLDVVRLESVGIYGSVSIYGAMMSEEQAKIIRRAKRVIAAFDNDPAGKKACEQIRDYARKYGFDLLFFNYNGIDVKDVGDMTPSEISLGLETAKHMLHGKAAYL